jgi:hypothetical protein
VAASQNMLARKCDELHMALAAKQSDCAAATMQSTKLQEDLNATKGLLAGAQVCDCECPYFYMLAGYTEYHGCCT